MQASICSGTNIVNVQIPRHVITNVNFNDYNIGIGLQPMSTHTYSKAAQIRSLLKDEYKVYGISVFGTRYSVVGTSLGKHVLTSRAYLSTPQATREQMGLYEQVIKR